MTALTPKDIIAPGPLDAELVRSTDRVFASHFTRTSGSPLEVKDSATGESLVLPESAARALFQVLTELGRGHGVAVMPIRSELSTQEAADMLNVSRPYLVKLVDEGAIPSRKVGVQRRLRLEDVVAYKTRMYADQVKGLDELTRLSQELGLYDDAAE